MGAGFEKWKILEKDEWYRDEGLVGGSVLGWGLS